MSDFDEVIRGLAAEHGFSRIDIGLQADSDFIATAWGDGIGLHGCTSMHGDTAREALRSVIAKAAQLRAIRVPALELEGLEA